MSLPTQEEELGSENRLVKVQEQEQEPGADEGGNHGNEEIVKKVPIMQGTMVKVDNSLEMVLALLPPKNSSRRQDLSLYGQALRPPEPGVSAPSGPSGPSGFSGPSGPSGPSGFSGPSGPSGPSGFAGPSGPSGPPGSYDPFVISVPSGPSAELGPSGVTGPSGPSEVSGPGSLREDLPSYGGPSGPSAPPGPSSPSGASGPEILQPAADSCYLETGCTASCSHGFRLLLPNTQAEDCEGAPLKVRE